MESQKLGVRSSKKSRSYGVEEWNKEEWTMDNAGNVYVASFAFPFASVA